MAEKPKKGEEISKADKNKDLSEAFDALLKWEHCKITMERGSYNIESYGWKFRGSIPTMQQALATKKVVDGIFATYATCLDQRGHKKLCTMKTRWLDPKIDPSNKTATSIPRSEITLGTVWFSKPLINTDELNMLLSRAWEKRWRRINIDLEWFLQDMLSAIQAYEFATNDAETTPTSLALSH